MKYLDKANSFISIYKDTSNYKNLIKDDKEFFDDLFYLLLVFGDLTMSNKELGARLKPTDSPKPIPVSTVEKRISRLKKAKLITGWEERERSEGRWRTAKRHLQLDPELFSFVAIKDQDKRIFTARLQATNKDIETLHPELKKISEEPAEPPPQNYGYKVEVRFS